ncbi:MAG TPA: biosynthetic-type acetolactate synthase large subunit [Candidatus Gallimonas intestinigallinarum]|uniref:Acetolactate synthase n=1 Tax=Candidatus Gallimonas intestinigallinarum TaxID=2838604 RepID=A0A9D2DVU0_9FIRM|nr:biosynthetic-type acetolactate synthase large subunit [Candidatus Gallimonas intestinigallinarum]
MKRIGAEILIECLKEQGVTTVFGYPGGTVLDIYDALYRDGTIEHVITSHEQGAAHAADGWARVTGKTGVVIATSGPGATNLVTGIATAYMDSIPVVAITGNVGASMLGRDSFQEIDIFGITLPITKHNYIVKDVKDLAGVVREAFLIANSGRKGPVLIDILKNVQSDTADYEPQKPVPVRKKAVPPRELEAAARAIAKAQRPLIMVGGGVIASEAAAEARALAERLRAPVASTLMGLGAFPASHPLFAGMMGMHGTATAAKLCMESDCIIALGTRFSDRVALNRDKFAAGKTVVQLEIDEAEIDKNVGVTYGILGDVKESLTTLIPMLPEVKERAFVKTLGNYRAQEKATAKPLELGHKVLLEAAKLAKESIVVTDVGQHQMWTAQYYPIEKPRTFCTSGGLGTMGYGLGAAIGAAKATGKHVILVTGDGCFNMNLNELSTAVTHELPITILLMNNHALGMVRQWQKLFYGNRFSQTDVRKRTDYVRFAESFGAVGLAIEKDEDIVPVLTKALATQTPVLVDCRISNDENVLPMIKPGQTYDTIITDWEARE